MSIQSKSIIDFRMYCSTKWELTTKSKKKKKFTKKLHLEEGGISAVEDKDNKLEYSSRYWKKV